MADPRFYDNRGPFALAQICGKAGLTLAPGCDGTALVADVASLDGAGAEHLSFFNGGRAAANSFVRSQAESVWFPPKVTILHRLPQ